MNSTTELNALLFYFLFFLKVPDFPTVDKGCVNDIIMKVFCLLFSSTSSNFIDFGREIGGLHDFNRFCDTEA